ncbi:MAG: hypothetical protein AAF333_18610 [Planctomycetota bacterium]
MKHDGFLARASEAGETHLRRKGTRHLFDADGSICLRREGGEALFQRLQRYARAELLKGLAAAVLGVGVMILGSRSVSLGLPVPPTVFYVVGVGLLVSVGWFLWRAGQYDRWIDRHAPTISESATAASELRPIRLTIEDPETFDQFKLVGDDCGFIAFLPSTRMILIEGIRYRQLIRAEDLTETYEQEAASVRSIALEYRVYADAVEPVVAKITLSSTKHWGRLQTCLSGCLCPVEEGELDGLVNTLKEMDTIMDPNNADDPGRLI